MFSHSANAAEILHRNFWVTLVAGILFHFLLPAGALRSFCGDTFGSICGVSLLLMLFCVPVMVIATVRDRRA